MKLIERNSNYIPTARITCNNCESILEITRSDITNPNPYKSNNNKYVKCCVCGEYTFVHDEVIQHLFN